MYQDKTISCRDCGEPFVFTAGEQEFYAQKGFTNEPTRCANCRRARKSTSGGGGGGGYSSDRSYGSGGGGGGGYSSDRSYGSGGGGGGGGGGGYRAERTERAPSGPLPAGMVDATVVKVAPDGRFMFVRLIEGGQDVYVHGTLLRQLPEDPQAGDTVRVSVEESDRGWRARELE